MAERASYAACAEHASVALDALDGRNVSVRKVVNDDDPGATAYHCHCGREARFFLLQREPWAVIVQQTQASRVSIGKLDVYELDSAFDAERFASRQEFPTQVLPLKEG